jgi:sodium transport system ATP-binding protein
VAHGRNVASGSISDLLAQTGQNDFEDAFVQLAFAAAPAHMGVGL